MKLSTLILIALLTSPGIGHPYRQHVPHHFKRQDIVWATHNNFVTETVDITTTIWVEEGFVSVIVSSLSSDKLLTDSF
jgi:hypothetical protein